MQNIAGYSETLGYKNNSPRYIKNPELTEEQQNSYHLKQTMMETPEQ